MTNKAVKVEFRNLPEHYSQEQIEYLNNFLLRLPPVMQGECTVAPFKSMISEDGALFIKVIIRNGSDNIIQINEMPLAVQDGKKQNVAVGIFHTEGLELQPYSAYLRTFVFRPEDILVEEPDMKRWTIHPQKVPIHKEQKIELDQHLN